MEPEENSKQVLPQVVIVPLVAFDMQLSRLGYGGGFYDRTIAGWAKKPILIGVGYEFQKVEKVPCDQHDIKLDYIVSETQIYSKNE